MRGIWLGCCILSLVVYPSWGNGLPLTLAGETAYTLSQGEWLIGAVRLPGAPVDFLRLDLRYGLTDRLQIGTKPFPFFLGLLNGEIKYIVGVVGGAVLSFKASLTVPFDLSSMGLGLGGLLSFPGRLGWHLEGELLPFPSWGFSTGISVDFSPFPRLHVLAEGRFPPARVLGGVVTRLWDLVLLRAVLGVEFGEGGVAPLSYLELFAHLDLK